MEGGIVGCGGIVLAGACVGCGVKVNVGCGVDVDGRVTVTGGAGVNEETETPSEEGWNGVGVADIIALFPSRRRRQSQPIEW